MNMATLAQTTVEQWLFRKTDATDLVAPTDQIFMLILWVSVFSFILLMSLMIYFVVVYRRRPGVAIERSSSHNTPLEIAWTVLPTIVLVVMFFDGFWVYIQQAIAPGDAIQMNLTAKKWAWGIEYPKGTVSTEATNEAVMAADSKGRTPFTYPIYYMPANTAVKLKMNSQDVMHSFYIPDFRIKFDVMPNRYTSIWFKANEPSGGKTLPVTHPSLPGVEFEDHWVFCAEYCGEQHSEMAAIIRVVPAAAYDRWAAANVMDMAGDPITIGSKLYMAKGCNACHSVDGGKNVGPSWKDLYGEEQEFADGTKVIADDNYLRESILVPAAKIVKGYPNQMPSYQGQLSDKELSSIIAYIQSLSAHAPAPAAAPADGQPTDGQPTEGKPADPAATPAAPAAAPAK
jgi:cytochrome c oxidase subunit 2